MTDYNCFYHNRPQTHTCRQCGKKLCNECVISSKKLPDLCPECYSNTYKKNLFLILGCFGFPLILFGLIFSISDKSWIPLWLSAGLGLIVDGFGISFCLGEIKIAKEKLQHIASEKKSIVEEGQTLADKIL